MRWSQLGHHDIGGPPVEVRVPLECATSVKPPQVRQNPGADRRQPWRHQCVARWSRGRGARQATSMSRLLQARRPEGPNAQPIEQNEHAMLRHLMRPATYVRSMTLVVVLWHVLAIRIGNEVILPRPSQVLSSFHHLIVDGTLQEAAYASVSRLAITLIVSSSVAVLLGILMGLSDTVRDVIDPVVEMLRPISSIVWIPLWLTMYGIGDTLPIFIIFYVSFFPLLLNTVAGVRGVGPTLSRAAESMGAGRVTVVRKVVLPAALPTILTGARLALAGGWMAMIAAELVGTTSGLGFLVMFYGSLLRTADMIAVITTIAVLGYLSDLALRRLKRALTPWAVSQ